MALDDKLNQAKGALKENAGKLTGDKKLEAEGVVENTAAKVKDVAHDVAEDLKNTAEDVKDAVDVAFSVVKNVLHKDDKYFLITGYHSIYTPANPRIYWFLLYKFVYTLKRKCVTSPSFITYSLPSRRTRPFSLAAFWLPQACKSSKDTISARIKPFSISEWILPAA